MYEHSDPYLQLWRNEPVTVNDCILRNIHKYQYIANIDNDEIILPEEYGDWHEMLSGLTNDSSSDMKVTLIYPIAEFSLLFQTFGAFCFWNTYFLEHMLATPFKNIPENLHMMQHVYRSQYDHHTKCLFNTETILTVTQHFIQDCIVSDCGYDFVHGAVGQYCY